MKFNRLIVVIVSIIIIGGSGYAMWHFAVEPAQKDLEQKKSAYEAVAMYDEAKLAQTRAYKEEQFAKCALDEARYQQYMDRFMPMLDFSRRDVGMISYWHETTGIGKDIVTNFARKDPVVLVNSASLSVPAAPTNPNDSLFDQDLITYSGSVSVQGDFRSILANIVRWSNAPRLVLVDPSITFTMQGNDPNKVQASYNITCYVFPRAKGGDRIEIAGGGSAPASGATGGMGGTMPGSPSMPSMPGSPSMPSMPTPPPPSLPSAPSA